MDPDPFQTEVAQVALSAAGEHGFALGGGHALIAHGVVWRQTEDVDLFTDRDSGVVDAMDIGPVLHIEDVAGSKMAAMITRAEPRDYIDVAAAMRVVGRDKLLAMAHRTDPSITAEEVAESVRRLDRLDDSVFQSLYGLNAFEVGQLRAAFADWPRS